MEFDEFYTEMMKEVWDRCGHAAMKPWRLSYIHKLIVENKYTTGLDLGTANGMSACCIANALSNVDKDTYHVDSIDLPEEDFKNRDIRNAQWASEKLNLSSHINFYNEASGYNWFLKRKIIESTVNNKCKPIYDFCLIDGDKKWDDDGLAFFLVDKLLKPNGMIIFDDLFWSYAYKGYKFVMFRGKREDRFCEEELKSNNVFDIVNLLVRQHSNYGEFNIIDNWMASTRKLNRKKTRRDNLVNYVDLTNERGYYK